MPRAGDVFCDRGAIVRIKLQNFMTYNETEICPGPNLNMILGPNGTGKSAIVCCIIVGLAGEVSLTGRGGSAADFVKRGKDSCRTEIELYNDNGRNFVVERTITITSKTQLKIETKNEWKINHLQCKKADVQNLMRDLNIKVDNLCQFLPQDSVTQFVKMNSSELLLNTLKAVGEQKMVDDYQKLINCTGSVRDQQTELDALERAAKENEINAKRLEAEVHQLRKREELKKQVTRCQKKIHFLRFTEAETKYKDIRTKKAEVIESIKQIENRSEPYLRAIKNYEQESARYRNCIDQSSNETRATLSAVQKIQNDIENLKVDCQNEYSKYKNKEETENHRENSIKLKEQELRSLERNLSEVRDVDLSRQISSLESELTALKGELQNCNKAKNDLELRITKHLEGLDETSKTIDRINAVMDKKKSLLRGEFPDAYRIYDWLSKNSQRFEKRIFLPLMCEIDVPDVRNSSIIENSVGRNDLSAFICLSPNDLSLFTSLVWEELRLRANVVLVPDKPWEDINREAKRVQESKPKDVSVSYLIDLIEAPDPVKRYLCVNSQFHLIPLVSSCTEAQHKLMIQSNIPKFYVGNTIYTVTKSRYDQQVVQTSDTVRPARILRYSLDSRGLQQAKSRYEEIKKVRDADNAKREEIIQKGDKMNRTWQEKCDLHKKLKDEHGKRRQLESLIERAQEAIRSLKEEKIDLSLERDNLRATVEKLNQRMVIRLARQVETYSEFLELKRTTMINAIAQKLANRNLRIAKKKHLDIQKESSRLNQTLRTYEGALEELRESMERLRRIAEEKISDFTRGKLGKNSQRVFDQIEENTVETLKEKIEDLEVRIRRVNHDSGDGVLDEFNRQNAELRERRNRIDEINTAMKILEEQRNSIKLNWLPRLQEIVTIINENYREFMRKLCYDGQVKLDFDEQAPDNFSSYGVMILVKYRDEDQLIPLSSTRQSGGERSVATMIYMLALQAKTSVPFRCVDEINQGMDKDNERKVFELLVKTADSSSSQYFLVSPKLLKNLPYSEKMKIHIVFNGKKLDLTWSDNDN